MSRIIYSIYRDGIDEHKSAPTWKQQQFRKYKHLIEQSHKDYAKLCGAEYKLFGSEISNYVDLQFEKLFLFEDLSKEYDEVLYLDFDVVPQTEANFFEVHDLSKICAVSINRTPDRETLKWIMNEDGFDSMNMYCKGCAKQAMLQIDGLICHEPTIINTGVLGGNKESIKELKIRERLDEARVLLEEAKEDSVFPEEITKNWSWNNEIVFTYIVEKYNVPFNNIGLSWNFFLCDMYPEITSAAHLIHHSNKEFERSFGDVEL